MGTLTLTAGPIYLDTVTIIYSVEKHVDYFPLLQPLWQMVKAGYVEIISSELALLEMQVVPLRQQDQLLIAAYEKILMKSELRLVRISTDILRQAAQLRADTNLKTPDAIHAATALANGCAQFITNDLDFRRVPNLNATVLSLIS